MVRRAPSGSTDSHNEEMGAITPAASQYNNKGKGVATNGRRITRNGSRRVIDEEEEEQEEAVEEEEDDREAEEEQEQGIGSPKGRKRARANTNGDSRHFDPSGSLSQSQKVKARGVTLPRGEDGFIPGSIVRVQLKNFVTYDHVEFRPGPYLNMVLGPNGTGKSSIACAICLGLNFSPHLLGRATDLQKFVKTGALDGHIEIELKGPKGKSNLVIRRTIHSKNRTSHFTLNGESATGKEVTSKMAELNVQVNNLCTFLPQDRVAEFARMTPQQLLRETERAAGNENLTSWHDALISSGKELKNLQEYLTADRDSLQTLEERNANLEREVKRYEERRALEQNIELLELILPFKEYQLAKEQYDDTKKQRDAALKTVRSLREAYQPITAFKANLQRKFEELEQQREAKKAATKRKFTQMKGKWDENEKLEQEAEDLKTKLDNLKTKERNRHNEIKKLEKNIQDIEHTLKHPPKLESLEDLNEEMRKIKNEHRSLQAKQSDLQERQRSCVDDEMRHKASLDAANESLKRLEDADHRKLEALRKWDPACADAVTWLRKNQSRFKMEVMEPPILSVTVTDKRYTQPVENCFSTNQLKTFVAQCDEDYRLFNRLVCDSGEALGRPVRVNTWARARGHISPQPMTAEEMKEVGFDGYALDFIRCPDGLKLFLQVELNLHRVAIALDPRRINPSHAMEMCTRGDSNAPGSGQAKYIIGTTLNNVTRSKYGKRLPQNTTKDCRPASMLVNTSVDPEIKRRFEKDAREATQELEVVNEHMGELANEESQLKEEDRRYKTKMDSLVKRKQHITDESTRLERLGIQLQTHHTKLEKLKQAPPIDSDRTQYKSRIVALSRSRLQLVKEYEKLVCGAIAEQAESTRVGLQYLQVSANRTGVDEICRTKDEEISEATVKFNRAQQEFDSAKQTAGQMLNVGKQKLLEVSAETREKFKALETSGQVKEKPLEEYAQELQDAKSLLETRLHANAGAVEQFKERKAKIEELKKTIEEREMKAEKKERQIKIARDNWEPALNKLVDSVGARFSAAFDRIGCAGEIRVSQNEDYDKWAIDILVKFRDNEKLQLLTGERQSGGERSLTTIMYLMSLTEEARTPFSLVDEINQGMDARAERAVHNSLVEVTCKSDSGQYFLITPKLLPDLTYHERMKVLCVYNGEWLNEEVGGGHMMSMIDAFVRARQRAPSAV